MADFKGFGAANVPYALLVDEDGNPIQVPSPTGATVDNNESVDVLSSDGSTTLATGTASVDDSTDPNTFSGIDLTDTDTVVSDTDTVPLTNNTGSGRGNVDAGVAANALTLALPAQADVVTDGQSKPVLNTAGDTTLAAASAKVPISDFDGLQIEGGAAVLTDGQASIDINQYDNSASFAVTVGVVENALNLTLANATTRIAVDSQTIQVTSSWKTIPVAVTVTQGAWGDFVVENGTDGLVSDGDAIAIQTVGGGAGVQGTTSVASSSLDTAVLPANIGMVQDGAGLTVPVTGTYTDTITPQVGADGSITGFVLS